MSGRSPGPRRAGPVGAPCVCLLQRCLALHLRRQGLVQPPRATTAPAHSPAHADPQSQQYWMYDSGYLVFQSFLEANQKCFWNASLVEAVRLLEFQGYVAPGVLLVRADPCALEVIRAAWSRNVLKAPPNYAISSVGDVEDCVIAPVAQGQFTPLAEALCWVVLDLTASGQPAVIDNVRAALAVAFPEMERPSRDLVYDTLAKLLTEKKLYQTSRGYFVVTPEHRRLRGGATPDGGGAGGSGGRQLLLSTEEAVAMVHGEMSTVVDGELTHQAVQTNLADVICGGNANDKVLYARSPARRAQLERRHSLRLFGSNKRLAALQRSGSMRHLPARHSSEPSTPTLTPLANSSTFSRKSLSLLSRLFRRSKRSKSSQPLQTFSAQFPPPEWFNSRVRHLHSVGTQTQAAPAPTPSRQRQARSSSPSVSSISRSRANSSSRLVERGWDRDGDTLTRHHRRSTTPTPSRPPSRHASPLPPAPSTSPSRSSLSSSKTVIHAKSMSSSSSGYNSLPRSSKSPKSSRPPSATSTPKSSPVHLANSGKNSITLQVSTNQNKKNYSSQCDTNIGGFISSLKSSVGEDVEDNSTTMTTTINGNNRTKIFVQQQNSPVRSIITFENGSNKNPQNHDLIIVNGGKPDLNRGNDKDYPSTKKNKQNFERPTSLYAKEETEDTQTTEKLFGQLESQLKMKFPSSETIQLEEKLLTSSKNNKNSQRGNVFDSTKLATGSLIDVTNIESELNNVRKASISSTPLQSYNKTENLSVKNLLKECEHPLLPLMISKESKNFISNPPSPTKVYPGDLSSPAGTIFNGDLAKLNGSLSTQDIVVKKDGHTVTELGTFPSLSDLSLHFTSLAAQNILKGVSSINSIDTLVEVNMAADKQNNRDVTVHTDLGVV